MEKYNIGQFIACQANENTILIGKINRISIDERGTRVCAAFKLFGEEYDLWVKESAIKKGTVIESGSYSKCCKG
jgi:hypothetical protein